MLDRVFPHGYAVFSCRIMSQISDRIQQEAEMATRGRKRKAAKEGRSLALIPYAPESARVEEKIVHTGVARLEQLAWFRRMDDDTKKAVEGETQQLSSAMLNAFRSKLAIGQHLAALQQLLEGNFVKFLRNFNFNQATAYRYIAGYKNATAVLPKGIIDVAAAKGKNLLGDSEDRPLGIYTAAAKKLPPPRDPSPEDAAKWLDNVEIIRKQLKAQGKDKVEPAEERGVEADPDLLGKEHYRVFRSRWRMLPRNSRSRMNWLEQQVGMMLTEAGISHKMSFEPVAIPDDFRQGRGRPRLVAVEA